MSTRSFRGTGECNAATYVAQGASNDAGSNGGGAHNEHAGGRGFDAQGAARRKRRRHRSQKGKRHHSGPSSGPHVDIVSRERMFQDIEGLLRQIRERAEEASVWTTEQLNDFTQTVTGFTKSLEQEGEQISQRARSEYQRIRDKLSQALRS